MTFQMINADKGSPQADGQTFSSTVADEKRGQKSWAARRGDAMKLVQGTTGTLESDFNKWTDLGKVIAGSNLGNDAPVLPVQINLAGYFGDQDFSRRPQERDSRLIARRFDR